MAYTVNLTSLAERDAYEAYEYIAADAPKRAEDWLFGLFVAIDTLGEMPHRCPVIPEVTGLVREVRHLLYGPYRILFDIQDAPADLMVVRVLRIWHGSRNRVDKSTPME